MSAKIREELREPDADAIAKDIVAIREWLEKQPHLPKDMGKFWVVITDDDEVLSGQWRIDKLFHVFVSNWKTRG